MFTIGDLLQQPELETRSLTPGVGESRPISWAHVCELADPWRWLGGNALVMTTGIPVPADPEGQCRYIEKMAESGIAAVAIGERMSAPPLSERMLERARQLGFPVLETAHGRPFITLALAVSEANNLERQQRVRAAEQLYQSLLDLPDSSSIGHLLAELSTHLGGALSIHAAGGSGPHQRGRVQREDDGTYTLPLPIDDSRELRFAPETEQTVDYALLQHAATIVSGVLATQSALSRQRWFQGSILLAGLFDESIPLTAAVDLVGSYGVTAPYVLAAWEGEQDAKDISSIERVGSALDAAEVSALFTVKEGRLNMLSSDSPALIEVLEDLCASTDTRIALSESFSDVKQLADAKLQTILTLSGESGAGVIRFEDRVRDLPFLPQESASRRQLATEVLGGLLDYDARGRSNLVRTLHVFLAENRSWVRSSERLFVHRQTLVSRIAKIEQLTGKSFSSTNDVAVLWFAIQCAIEEGMLGIVE